MKRPGETSGIPFHLVDLVAAGCPGAYFRVALGNGTRTVPETAGNGTETESRAFRGGAVTR